MGTLVLAWMAAARVQWSSTPGDSTTNTSFGVASSYPLLTVATLHREESTGTGETGRGGRREALGGSLPH